MIHPIQLVRIELEASPRSGYSSLIGPLDRRRALARLREGGPRTVSSAALETSPHSDWQARSRAVQPTLDPSTVTSPHGEEVPSVATLGTRAVRVNTRAMYLSAYGRSRRGEGPSGSDPTVDQVAKGQGRKVLFGGDRRPLQGGCRRQRASPQGLVRRCWRLPQGGCHGRWSVRGISAWC
jgi:hypothetical protein